MAWWETYVDDQYLKSYEPMLPPERTGRELKAILRPRLLAVARRNAEVAGVELTLVQGDRREIPFRAEFDAIVNLFTGDGRHVAQ